MPILNINGLNFNAMVLGNGSPIVMLHGMLLGNLSSWYLAAGHLLSPERSVVLYDLRGHGNSDVPPSGYGLKSMSLDLAGVAETLKLDGPFDLAGFSYGSLIALRFALDNPARVRRLILAETPLPPLGALVDRYLNADLNALLDAIPAVARQALLASPRRAASTAMRTRRLVKDTSLVTDVCAEPAFTEAELKGMPVPTLCIHGNDSEFLEQGRYLATNLPSARLVTLPSCSHQLLNDNPAQTAALIKEFIDG